MTMSNGTATQQERKLKFKPRNFSHESLPIAPEGEWEAMIPKGKCKVTTTQDGDPSVIVVFKLMKAENEKNASFQGMELPMRIILFADDNVEKRRGANLARQRLRQLCEACDLEFAEAFPTEIEDEDSLKEFFDSIEGKSLTVWTVERSYKARSGEEVTDVEIRFTKPGAGLVTREEEDGNDERPSKKKTANRRR